MRISESTRKKAGWIWARSLDILFPRTCVGCGALLMDERGGYTCTACRERIAWLREPLCTVCGTPFYGSVSVPGPCPACRAHPPAFERCRALFLHKGTGGRIVHTLKYAGGRWLEQEIAAILRERADIRAFLSGCLLVPVPLHPAKLRQRGYNQSEVIIRAALREVEGARCLAPLARVRKTPSQTLLTREERLQNMSEAFDCDIDLADIEHLMLVDDVLTTGATLNAAASALRSAGATRISAFTLAHG